MQYGIKQAQQHPANTHRAAEIICVRLFDMYSTRVTICLLQLGHCAPVGPGPIFCGPITVVLVVVGGGCGAGAVATGVGGTTIPGGGG